MSIGEICNRSVVIATGDDTIMEIAGLMREYHVGDVVIVEKGPKGNKPVGIITDRDVVLQLVARNVDLKVCTAKDVMSYELITAKENDGLWEVLQRMRMHGVRRIPIVNGEGALLGIISADDFLDLLASELSELVKIMRKEQSVEKARRT